MPKKLPDDLPCGTEEKYRQHIRNGEPTDAACRAAHRAYHKPYSQKHQEKRRYVRNKYKAEFTRLRLEYLYAMQPYEYGYIAPQHSRARQLAESFLIAKYKDEIPDVIENADR